MPKVFYTGQSRETPPPEHEWQSDGTASEAETDVETPLDGIQRRVRPKAVHRRTDSTDTTAQMMPSSKRTRRVGNAIVRQRESSREIRDATGQRPLQKACSKGDYGRVVMILERNDPDLQDRDYAGTTALHSAALLGDERIVSALLRAGAVPDVRSGPEELDTPLMDAAANGSLPVVKLLIEHGADPRIRNSMGRIALDFVEEDSSGDEPNAAIIDTLTSRMKELRRAGAPIVDWPTHPLAVEGLFPPGFAGIQRPAAPTFLDITKRSTWQEIAEHASMGHLEYVGSALERGWRPSGDALVKAARFGHADIVGLLLAFGLDANIQVGGTTPLREAIKRDHLPLVKLLLESGASIKKEDKKLVTDLPGWDELRAVVLGVSPDPVPDSLKFQKPKREESNSHEDKETISRKNQDLSSSPTAPKTSEEQPLGSRTEEKELPTSSSTLRGSPASNANLGVKLSSTASSTRAAASRTDANPELKPESKLESKSESKLESKPSMKAQPSVKNEFKLSKLDLRSIKPKKKSKSVPETAVVAPSEQNVVPHTETLPAPQNGRSTTLQPGDIKASDTEGPVEKQRSISPGAEPSSAERTANNHKENEPVEPPQKWKDPFPDAKSSHTPIGSPIDIQPRAEPLEKFGKSSTPTAEPVRPQGEINKDFSIGASAVATETTKVASKPEVTASSGEASKLDGGKEVTENRREHSMSREIWAERSQELRQLAERKQKERRDREARMLESIAEEKRRRSESETATPDHNVRRSSETPESASATPKAMSPVSGEQHTTTVPNVTDSTTALPQERHKSSSPAPNGGGASDVPEPRVEQVADVPSEQQRQLVSVKSLPWALRKLAYSGEPQPASPLFTCDVNGTSCFIDIQVSLVTGDVSLHTKFPTLAKTVITTRQKQLLWPFCRAWICRSGVSSVDEVNADHEKFMNLPICWLPVADVEKQVLHGSFEHVSTVAIQLEPSTPAPKAVSSGPSLWWQARVRGPNQAW